MFVNIRVTVEIALEAYLSCCFFTRLTPVLMPSEGTSLLDFRYDVTAF